MPTLSFSDPIGIDIPDGGLLRWSGAGGVPETIGRTDTGAILGPLEFAIPPDGTLDVSEVRFTPDGEPDEGEGDGLIDGLDISIPGLGMAGAAAGAGAVTAPDTDATPDMDSDVTRRTVLGLAGAIAGSLALSGIARGQDDGEEQVTLTVATLQVEAVSDPYSVRVLDIVDSALPPSTELLIDQSGTRIGAVGSADERIDLQPEPGEVRIYVRDSISSFSRLMAWASSFTNFDDSIAFSRSFPGGSQAADYDEETIVRLTEHPAIVDPVREAGPEATRLRINSTTIPHVDDGATEAGAWDVLGEALIYEAGSNPPDASEWTVETRLGWTDRIGR